MKVLQVAPILLLLLSAPEQLTSESRESKQFSYPVAGDFLVVERRSFVPLTPGTDGPWTRIYGDGRVEVHRPSYMRDGGDYQAWLSLADVDALLTRMDEAGLMVFDIKAVKKKHMEAERRKFETSGEVPVVSDAGTDRLTIRVKRYGSEYSSGQEVFVKVISWNALPRVVEWYPKIEELVALNDVVTTIRELAMRVRHAAHQGETMVTLPE